jgi:phage tail-like protein
MAMDYPPVAFHFGVTLVGITSAGRETPADASFQEVSGIRVESGHEEVVEGGQNKFVHRLPKQATYGNLVLKRGVVVLASPLADWVAETLGSELSRQIKLRNVMVTLKNEQHDPLITWTFVNAYPVKWETASLNSMESSVLTETMELSYQYFERAVIDRRSSPASDRPHSMFEDALRRAKAGLRKVS